MSEIVEKLKKQNLRTLTGARSADLFAARRIATAQGQRPCAVVIACADSRVIPEAIFDAGLGELFVIRAAGNVIAPTVTGSVEYAVRHLGVRTVIVMGHTRCGAVSAALQGEFDGYAGEITKKIKAAIGNESDPVRASCLNAVAAAKELRRLLPEPELEIVPALYDILSGTVTFDCQ